MKWNWRRDGGGLSVERQVEQWFHRRGLARLLDGTPVRRGTAVESAPALVLLFVFVMLAVVPDLLPISFAKSFLVTVPVLIVSWVISNLLRRRRPLARVRAVGWFEGFVFIVVPALVVAGASGKRGATQVVTENGTPYYLPNDWVLNTIGIVMVQTVLLVLVVVLTKSGLLSVSRWLAKETISGVSGSAGALAGALPVLLGVVFFFFLNPGVWASVGKLDTLAYGVLIGLLVVLSGAFLGSRRQLDVEALTTFDSVEELRAALAGTPLADAAVPGAPLEKLAFPLRVPLHGRAALNVRLVAVLSRLVVATVVGSAVFLFFTVLGLIAVDSTVVKGWTQQAPLVLWKYVTVDRTYIISAQQMRVAGFLGVFSGFYFSLVSATDGRLRIDAQGAATDMIRQACAQRAVLLAHPDDLRRQP